MWSSTMFLVLLCLSTCCLALPRKGSIIEDLPQPVLPQALSKAIETDDTAPVLPQALSQAVESDDSAELTADTKGINSYTITDIKNAIPRPFQVVTLTDVASASMYNGLKVLQNIYVKDNIALNKLIEYFESFRIIKQINDSCSDEDKKHEVSCTELHVAGFYDTFGKTWHKISSYFIERYNRIDETITEKKDKLTENIDKIYGTSTNTVVTDPDTYFSRFVKFLKIFRLDGKPGTSTNTVVTDPDTYVSMFVKFLNTYGLDGKPVVTYDRERDGPREKKDEEKKDEHKEVTHFSGKTPQEIKDEALKTGFIRKIEKHNYFAKAVNAGIKLTGLGVFAALCAQNCGIENLLGLGTPLPPLDADDQAANDAAIAADAAGDTDGDNDVDGDDANRRDTLVSGDSYQGYNHNGDYFGYNPLQPQSQPQWNNYFKGGNDPGYAHGTFPGWYPPQINNDDDSYSKHNTNNNHLLEPEEHPDFSSRLGQAREVLPKAIHSDTDNDNLRSVVHERRQSDPQPVYRGGRMFHLE